MTVVTLSGQSGDYMFYHNTYTTDDGLSSRFLQDIYQDSRDFIWVSSDYGVNQFDGEKFKVYNQVGYNLKTDDIHFIREDQRGNLWFISRLVTYKNEVRCWRKVTVDIFDYYKNEVIPLEEYLGENIPFQWSSVIKIEQDDSYALWITTIEGKVYRYTDRFIEISISYLIPGGLFQPLPNGEFLIIGSGKIIKLNAELKPVYELDFKQRVYSATPEENGHVYVITDPARILYEIDSKGNMSPFKGEVKDRKQKVNRFGIDIKGRLWIEGIDSKISVYQNGIRVLDEALEKFNINENSNHRIKLVRDKTGGIWYGDLNGLNYLSLNKSGFTSYFSEGNISLRNIIELSDSTFFVNSYSGYFLLNKNTGYYEPFEIPDNKDYAQGGILYNGFIYNSQYSFNVLKVNLEEQTGKLIPMNVPFINPKTFILGPDSTILVGADVGLFILDPKTDTVLPYKKYNEFENLGKLAINSFAEINGLYYVSTEKGLYLLDWEKGIVAHHSFIYNNLMELYVDEEDVFWIATRGGGLLEWHPRENIVHQYTVKQGLSHDIIYDVFGDRHNQLWLPSNKGLMRFNKADKTVVTFLKDHGIGDNEFNQYAHYEDKNGKFYMGGIKGMVSFDPDFFSNLGNNNSDARIVVTEVTVVRTANKTSRLPINDVNRGVPLIIRGDVQSTDIKFSLLNYDRFQASKYFYKIEGIHEVWQPMKGRYVRLAGLPGGTHKILVKVNGGVNLKTYYSEIEVNILKPFTQTWLFYGICALGFLALGVSLSRYRIYHLDKVNQRLERKVIQRTKKIEADKVLISQQYREMEQINKIKNHLIAIIGHDLKDYVSTFEGIEKKINYLIGSKQVERIPQLAEFIENSAHDLSLLLDNLLNWALKERGDLLLHPDSISVKSILQDVLKRLNKSIDKKEITLRLDISEDLRMYVDGLTLHSLLRNIIHNAIKFSYRKGMVRIYHTEEDDFVTLHIEDRGIGMTANQIDQVLTDTELAISTRGTENELGTGMGLLLCREMLEMQSGSLSISSTTNKGTVFSVRLPNRTPSTGGQLK